LIEKGSGKLDCGETLRAVENPRSGCLVYLQPSTNHFEGLEKPLEGFLPESWRNDLNI